MILTCFFVYNFTVDSIEEQITLEKTLNKKFTKTQWTVKIVALILVNALLWPAFLSRIFYLSIFKKNA